MPTSRAEHLAWCKQRALEVLESGDLAGAIASMISDLQKWTEPVYDPLSLQLMAADGMMFQKTPDQVRHWITGFN